MKIYQYHPVTKEFLGESVADESPLEPGVWLIPGSSTTIPSPTVEAHKIPIWNGDSWDIVDDYRGTTIYDTETGTSTIIKELSIIPTITTPPPEEYVKPQYINGEWIETQTEYEKTIIELNKTDITMLRVIDDIYSVLTAEQKAALPAAAVEKLNNRQLLREKL